MSARATAFAVLSGVCAVLARRGYPVELTRQDGGTLWCEGATIMRVRGAWAYVESVEEQVNGTRTVLPEVAFAPSNVAAVVAKIASAAELAIERLRLERAKAGRGQEVRRVA